MRNIGSVATQVVVHTAGAWHEFVENSREWLVTEDTLIIVPGDEDKIYVAQALADDINPDMLVTIPDLVTRCIGENRLISKHEVEFILGSIIGDEDMVYLKMEQYRQGYVKALADFIVDFRHTAATDLRVALAAFKEEERLTEKESDLIKIYAEYEKSLPEHGFDLHSGLSELDGNVTEDNIHRQLGIERNTPIIFFGFNHLTPLESKFIEILFKNKVEFDFLLCEDDRASEQVRRIQNSILELVAGFEERVTRREIPAQREDWSVSLARRIFNINPTDQNDALWLPASGKVRIATEKNRLAEVVSMARRIKQLAETGISLSEIRVVIPDYPLYSAIIQEVFHDYGISFNLENGAPLTRFPLAALILHLMNQSIHPSPYPLREKIFSSPYIRYSSPIAPEDLVKYQKVQGVEFLPGEQLRRLMKSGTIYRLDYLYLKQMRERAYRQVKPEDGISQPEIVQRYLDAMSWKSEAEKENSCLQCLIQFYLLSRAEKELYPWQARLTGMEFKNALLELINRFHIEENIKLSAAIFSSAEALELGERDAALFHQIKNLLDELVVSRISMDGAATEKASLTEWVRIFTRLMNEASLSVSGKGPASVTIQPVWRGQYQQWGYSFLCGLVDGEFPQTEAFNFLQPKKEGMRLGNLYTGVDHARNRLYQLLRSTSKEFFLSLPLSYNGKKLPPSPFVKEVEQCLPDAASEEADQRREVPERLYSGREKLRFIGKNVDRYYEKVLPLFKELRIENKAAFDNIREIMRYDGLILNALSFTEYDGVFKRKIPDVLDPLGEAIDKITFTPAILERYAICPLRFFLDDILHLRIKPDYHPDTAEAGSLILSVLREFTAKICESGGIPDEAEEILQGQIARCFQAQYQIGGDAFQNRFRNSLVAGLGEKKAGRPGLFSAFLEYEKTGPDRLRPYRGSLTGLVKLGDGWQIRVEIDRVDLTRNADFAVLYLYTTTQLGNPAKIFKGIRFDLPMAIRLFHEYALANDLSIPVGAAGVYVVKNIKTIKRGGYLGNDRLQASRRDRVSDTAPLFSGQREGFVPERELTVILEKVENHILRLRRLMKQGVFHPSLGGETEWSCENCSFGRICRRDPLRLERIWSALTETENINVVKEII